MLFRCLHLLPRPFKHLCLYSFSSDARCFCPSLLLLSNDASTLSRQPYADQLKGTPQMYSLAPKFKCTRGFTVFTCCIAMYMYRDDEQPGPSTETQSRRGRGRGRGRGGVDQSRSRSPQAQAVQPQPWQTAAEPDTARGNP